MPVKPIEDLTVPELEQYLSRLYKEGKRNTPEYANAQKRLIELRPWP